ncbi:hypothetical protein BH11BAC2_BH11BAC2_16900 [soil metagenome]
MKSNKSILVAMICVFLLAFSSVKAQSDTLKVHTSAECGTCKSTIEKNLNFEKGVKRATLNVDDKIVTIIYNPEKTTPAQLRKAISDIGYDADSIPANPKAYQNLKSCCKKDGH